MNQFQLSSMKSSSEPSDSPGSTSKAGSTKDSESSSGFRSFWRKSGKAQQSQNVTFVSQDPSHKRRKNRISRILQQGNTSTTQDEGEKTSPSEGKKRRQQVYQAQKRHRNRKAEYVQSLEAEVARLQHLDAMVNSEKNALAHQNNAIKEFLASQSLDVHLDSMALSGGTKPSDELSQLGSASVDIRFDPEMDFERVFLDFPDWLTSEGSTDEEQPSQQKRKTPVMGDSWAALDFILALEWPCREHIKHHAINPDAKVPAACDVGGFHGHALTATAAVYQSAQPPPGTGHEKSNVLSDNIQNQRGLHPSTADKWQMPHSEIDKLVELAELLELDDEWMTPAQAYSAVREYVPKDSYLRPTLEALKKPLGSLVQCQGFGSCMEAAMFWQHLEGTVESLKFTRPELA